ncbi:MAG: ATP-dependent helicase, partial [Betaproteobacteria bacterium]
ISLFAPAEEKYLLDIEKLTKAPITRATLQIPGERSARPSRYSAPAKPIDEFFLKPYEPSAAAIAAAAQAPVPATKKPALLGKRPVGLLLGGVKKP